MQRFLRPVPAGYLLLYLALAASASAQGTLEGQRSTYRVSTSGAWVDVERGRVTALPPAPVPTPVVVQDLAAGLVWARADGGQGWVGQTVALGQHGTLAFTEFDNATDRAELVSCLDVVPLTPLWNDPQPWTSQDAKVDAATEAGVFVSCRQIPVTGSTGPRYAIVSKYSASSTLGPDWEYTFPVTGYGPARALVSADGTRIVAGMLDQTGGLRLAIFDGNSGVPNFTTTLTCGPQLRALLLSDDGSTLYWASGSACNVWDIETHTSIGQFILMSSLDCHALSGDGRVFAFGGFNTVDVYERQVSGSYQHTHHMTVPGQAVCGKIDISADGSTLVAGFNLWDFNVGVTIRALDIPTKTLTMTDTAIGAGTYQNVVSDISVSADGQRFAVGLWGDQAGLVPELRLYIRDRNLPVQTFDYPGSIYSLEMSPDGRRVLVGTKAVHANVYASGGTVDLHRFGDEDFVGHGIPSLGDKVRFTLDGAPNSPALLAVASRPSPPTQVPGFGGSLHLDRLTMTTRYMGVTDAAGMVSWDYDLGTNPLLVGTTWFFQGLTLGPRQFTEDWLQFTVLP
jgi:WD40 repeat protein